MIDRDTIGAICELLLMVLIAWQYPKLEWVDPNEEDDDAE